MKRHHMQDDVPSVGPDDKKIANGRPGFSNLPNELLSKILLSLELTDLFGKCSLVCRRWRSMVMSDCFFKQLLFQEFDRQTVANFLSLPDSLSRLRADLQNNAAFSPSGLKLDGRSSSFEVGFSHKINSIGQFVESLRTLEDKSWLSRSHIYVNGGFCNHYWYWLINISQLLNFPEIISTLATPFAIGGSGVKTSDVEPLFLYDENLELLQEPLEAEEPLSFMKCWTMKGYRPGVRYVALEISDDLCGNEDLPLRLFWPSQMAQFEQVFAKNLKIRPIPPKYYRCLNYSGDGNNTDEDSNSDSESGVDRVTPPVNRWCPISSETSSESSDDFGLGDIGDDLL